jgi:ankyrin repeat protein
MASRNPPAGSLPERPNLDYLKKLAKARLVALRARNPASRLADAQLAVAREHGFPSWRALRAEIGRRLVPNAQTIASFAKAIQAGDVPMLGRVLRETPALLNIDVGDGESGLHLAAENNQASAVKFLLSAGANVSAKLGRSGHTPLSWAVTVGSFDAAEAFVKHGVKPDLFCAAGMGDLAGVGAWFTDQGLLIPGASQTGSSRYDASGNLLPCPPTTDVELISDALYAAARNGRANVIRELLAHGPDMAFRAYCGGTPLHWAYFSGSKESVDLLLAAGADPNLRDDAVKCSARAFGICIPASWGFVRKVEERLAEDPTLANIFEGRGTPLHEAARSGNAPICALLLKAGADPSILDGEGKTALDLARSLNRENAIRVLTTPAAAISPARSLHDQFIDAALPRPDSDHKSGSLEPARKMLQAHPELAGASTFSACVCGDAKAVARHLADDPSLATATGGIRNWPALCCVTFSRFLRDQKKRARDFVKCARLLLDAGADPNSSWPAAGDPTYRETALYGAAGIANCAPLAKLLIDAGADVNDHESLYHASEFADNAALRVLLEAKPDPKWVSYNLCHKMDMEDPAGVAMFIKHGADVNMLLDRGLFKGSRPLHFAIYRRRSLKVLRLLLNAGADPNLTDSKGLTPYELARRLGLNTAAKLLRARGADDELDPRAQFLAALSSGDRTVVNRMLRKDPTLKSGWTDTDHRLLVDAAEAGTVDAVRLILDIGFPITARLTSYGGWDASALDYAAWNGHGAIVRLLLKRGADPTLKHGYGGDALGAAIHGANHNQRVRTLSAVKALAAVATTGRLESAIQYARSEPNQKVTTLLQHTLNLPEKQRARTI